jgi:hypothetical protein
MARMGARACGPDRPCQQRIPASRKGAALCECSIVYLPNAQPRPTFDSAHDATKRACRRCLKVPVDTVSGGDHTGTVPTGPHLDWDLYSRLGEAEQELTDRDYATLDSALHSIAENNAAGSLAEAAMSLLKAPDQHAARQPTALR